MDRMDHAHHSSGIGVASKCCSDDICATGMQDLTSQTICQSVPTTQAGNVIVCLSSAESGDMIVLFERERPESRGDWPCYLIRPNSERSSDTKYRLIGPCRLLLHARTGRWAFVDRAEYLGTWRHLNQYEYQDIVLTRDRPDKAGWKCLYRFVVRRPESSRLGQWKDVLCPLLEGLASRHDGSRSTFCAF